MNFPFFIARRYLFSKKSTHVINVISSISVIGVAVATMALVIVLSVFNGFHDLVASLFTSLTHNSRLCLLRERLHLQMILFLLRFVFCRR